MWKVPLAWLLSLATWQSPIKRDEVVVFFPTHAHLDASGMTWIVSIHGWIHEPESDSIGRRLLLEAFRKALELEEADARSATFTARALPFLADNERGKMVPIRLGETVHRVGPSRPNGHFTGTVRLTVAEGQALADEDGWVTFRAVTREGDARVFEGRAQLIGPRGVSIISDIDDTIKISEVRDKKALLANTFLKEFQPVAGMAEAYRAWSGRGAAFHYVSSSPWQLYGPLASFLRANGFPEGPVHLKDFRWTDTSFFNLFLSPEETKPAAIAPILEAFPERTFILVGDSGEKDPEVYAGLKARYPERIARIIIRDVTAEGAGSERYRRVFANVPKDQWRIINSAEELKNE